MAIKTKFRNTKRAKRYIVKRGELKNFLKHCYNADEYFKRFAPLGVHK